MRTNKLSKQDALFTISRMRELENNGVCDIVVYFDDFDEICVSSWTVAKHYIEDDDQIILRAFSLDDVYPGFGENPNEDAEWLIENIGL